MKTKSTGLATAVWNLKRDLDVHEMIASNIEKLDSKACDSFFGYVYWRSLNSMIMNICKIYEREKVKNGHVEYPLNSIPSICNKIESENYQLPSSLVSVFLTKYGNTPDNTQNELQAFLETTREFGPKHNDSIASLKKYRDQHGAHIQELPTSTSENMPSYQSMHELFEFAHDFCEIVGSKEGPISFIDDKITVATMKIIAKVTDLDEAEIKTVLE